MNQYATIEKAIKFIHSSSEQNPSLEDIAKFVNLSPFHFQRVFTEWAGISPKKFLQYIHLTKAKEIFQDKTMTLLDASVDLGLSSTGRLHDLFIKLEGMSPGEYKKGGDNLTINTSYRDSLFGKVLIASTHKGICSIQFSEDKIAALSHLQENFPHAKFVNISDSFQDLALKQLTNPNSNLSEIKLHVKGTGFQMKVWEALLKIPMGKMYTYGSLASSIQMPTASRAVGSAIARNPIAFLIPCHRVIQSSGNIGEYRWNSDRKTAILAWEAVQSINNLD
jgi:AraC family transcriptional regulator of adaptative response/methylated-DNA-[protein]-cysteine methyltransferase